MAEFFIYLGLGIVLLVSLFGVYVGLRVWKAAGWKIIPITPPTPALRRLTLIWASGMAIGFVSLLIAMSMVL